MKKLIRKEFIPPKDFDTCDEKENMNGEPYIIDGAIFEVTYKLYKNDSIKNADQ
jgi:hypothetical protein